MKNEETIASLRAKLTRANMKYKEAASSESAMRKENLRLSAMLSESEKSLAWYQENMRTMNLENLQLKAMICRLEESR